MLYLVVPTITSLITPSLMARGALRTPGPLMDETTFDDRAAREGETYVPAPPAPAGALMDMSYRYDVGAAICASACACACAFACASSHVRMRVSVPGSAIEARIASVVDAEPANTKGAAKCSRIFAENFARIKMPAEEGTQHCIPRHNHSLRVP